MQLSPSLYLARMCHLDMSTSDSSSDDAKGVSRNTDQRQMRSVDGSLTSQMQLPGDEYRAYLHHGDLISYDNNSMVSANSYQGQSLLQEHESHIPVTSQEILYDLLETQRVSLSSYINVVKKRLLSSLGVIKIPSPDRKSKETCHPPSK